MRQWRAQWFSWLLCVVTALLLLSSRIMLPAQEWQLSATVLSRLVGNALIILSCAGVGALILSRRPGNAIGQLLALAGLMYAAAEFTGEYAMRGFAGASWVALLPDPLWVAAVPLAGTLLLLVFPTGHVVSPHWRLVAWGATGAAAALMVTFLVEPGELEYRPGVVNPAGLPAGAPILDYVQPVAAAVLLISLILAAGSAALRWRGAGNIQRQQLKWLTLSAVLMVAVVVPGPILPPPFYAATSTAVGVLFPVSVGVAVLRYQLYEVDRLLNRTLVYGMVTAAIVTTYLISVTALLALSPLPDDSALAVAVSTLAAASLARPLRNRSQKLVDRHFNRTRYHAAGVLADFRDHARDEVDLEAIATRLLIAARATVQPTVASLWLAPNSQPYHER